MDRDRRGDDGERLRNDASGLPQKHVPHTSFGYYPWSVLKRKMGRQVLKGQRAKRSYLDESKRVDMPVSAGQFFLFSEGMVHMAGPNRTDRRRTGLAVRVTVPLVKIRHDEIFPGHKAILINGEDRFGWNQLADPPE